MKLINIRGNHITHSGCSTVDLTTLKRIRY